MSAYIKKIEQDYNDGNITLEEINKLREDYNKLSAYDKGNLDIKSKKEKVDSKTYKPQPKISNEEKVINLLREQNSKLSTIKSILQFFFAITIISISFYLLFFGFLFG
mgnify:CR=1 FL=1